MIDGMYDVRAKTPLGKKAGKLELATDGDKCTADLEIRNKTRRLEGTVCDGMVTFEGSVRLPFPIGSQDFVLEGMVDGDRLSGVCRTKKFSFDVEGTRAS